MAVELTPEGPQRADLAEDIAAALAANPAAGAFFDTLAQFYRKAYLRYIDATTAGRTCARRASPRSWTCSRPASRSGRDREGRAARRAYRPPDDSPMDGGKKRKREQSAAPLGCIHCNQAENAIFH